MNIMKRVLSLLLCVAMLAAYLPAAGSAAAAESNVTATVDKTVVNVGETVEVTLSYKDMKVSSIGAGIRFDTTMLECVEIVGHNPNDAEAVSLKYSRGYVNGSCSTLEQANNEGTVGFVVGGTQDVSYKEADIYTATFKALKKGTVNITAYEDSDGESGYNGDANTVVVTVKGPSAYLPVSETAVKVGDEFEVTLSYYDMTVSTFNCGIRFDTSMLECVSIMPCDPEYPNEFVLCGTNGTFALGSCSTVAEANGNGRVGFGYPGTKDAAYKACDIFTVTFKAKETGTTTITAFEKSDGAEAIFADVDTQKITIKPLCEHSDSVNDGNHTCDLCGEPDVSDHITATKEETTRASCDKEGKVETVTFCSDCGKELNRVVKETIPAGHTWGEPGYTWADDYSTCTAARSCTVCEEGKAQETVTASAETTGTNCTDRKTTYTANFTADWAETQTKEVNLPAEHGELRITINKTNALHQEGDEIDGYSANCGEIWTLTVFCVKCRTAVMEVKRDSVVDISREPTCTKAGQHTHTTSFADVVLPDGASWDNRSGNGYDGYRTEIYDPDRWDNWNHDLKAVVKYVDGYPFALGHSWNTTPAYYRDNGDGTHTAIYTCKNDVTHEKEGTTANHTFVDGVCVCEAKQTFTVTWYDADGNELDTTTVIYGETPAHDTPKAPVETGYTFTFQGWAEEKDGQVLNELPAVTSEASYYAVFTKSVKTFQIDWLVKGFNEDGTIAGLYPTYVAYGQPIDEPKMTWVKEGYTFSGWLNVPENMPADNLVIYGEWTVNSYTVTWNVDGEKFAETTVEYGAAITAPEMENVKEGYTFSGWEVPKTMPAKDITLEATWEANTYTVTWNVDGNTDTKTTQTYGETLKLPTEPSKTGYTFAGWFTAEDGGDQVAAETVFKNANNDTVYYAQWTAKMYQINWYANGGYMFNNTYLTSTVTDQPFGAVIQTPPHNAYVQREGYTFTGWNTKADGTGETLTADTIMTEASDTAVIYYAQWKVNSYNVTFTINGEEYKKLAFAYGAAVTAPAYEVPEGHSFTGWTVPEKMPAENITLDASLTVNTYVVTWNVNGEKYTTTEVKYGETVTAPEYTVPQGHTFSGWDVPAKMPAKDLTIDATLTVNSYKVTFNVNGKFYAEKTVAYGAAVTAPDYTVPEGHSFSGWTVPTTMPAENLTIDATLTVNKYDVTFTIDGKEYTTLTFEYGAEVTAPEYTVPEGYTFSGWDVPAKMPAKDLTIDATLTVNSYKVTFNVNGKFYAEKTVAYGAAVTAPDYTVPEGHSFSGWTVPEKMPAENITLDAALTVNSYNVTFTINGEEYKKLAFAYGAAVTAPAYEIPEGHTFSGWTVPEKMPAENITLDASLTVNVYHVVLLNLNGDKIDTREGKYGDFVWIYLPDGVASIEVNDEARVGTWTGNGLWKIVNADGTETELTGTTTIPVDGLTVRAQYDFTGWVKVENRWTYEIENVTQKTGWTEIGDAWYYLDPETGYRAEGVARVPYPTKEINGITYAPDQESIDYAASKNQTFIDAEEAWFVFGENGVFQYDLTDMGTYLEATRYVENGHIAWHPGMVKSGDDYYYFIGDVENGGNIMATGDIYISRDNTDFGAVKSGVYTFAEDGKLCEYNGITEVNGKLRYYDDAQLMIGAGLVKLTVDGETKYIYVRSNGELVVDAEYWVANVNDHTEINVGTAKFDKNGYMIIEVAQVAKTGVYLEEGKWVYYVEGAKQYNAGLVLLPAETKWFNAAGEVVKELDAEAYVYVRSNAQLATGTYWITNVGQTEMAVGKYDFDEFGLMQSQMNGIYLVEGNLVYYVNNQIAYNAGLIRHTGTSSEGVKYDNDWIYVRSNGQLATGTYWITNTNEEMASGKYTFDADGKMIVTKIADGIHEENGKLYYYQDGVKQVGTGLMQLSDGSYIYVKSTGELVVDTDYYVTNNHGLLPQAIYYFGADGIMVR